MENQSRLARCPARIVGLESPQKIAELLPAVGVPEGGDTGYFFFTLSADEMTRYYPFKFKRPAP